MKRLLLSAGALIALAACSTTSLDQSVYAMGSAYTLAAQTAAVYEALPTADPSTVAQIKTYDEQVYDALVPLETALANGQSVTDAAEVEAAQAAVTGLTSYLASKGIK